MKRQSYIINLMFGLLLMPVTLLTGCGKSQEVYTEDINESINVQTASMTALYDIVQIHLVNAQNQYSYYSDHCFARTADTTGTLISDMMVLNGSACLPIKPNITTGSYTSKYSTSFPAILDTAAIQLNLTTNGVTMNGVIKYFYQTPAMVRVLISNMEITDIKGKVSYLAADLFMFIGNGQTELSGSMSFTGAHDFEWKSTTSLSGPNDFAYASSADLHTFFLTTGLAEFDFTSIKIIENFGDGQDDDIATMADESGERKILMLVRL